MDSDPLRYILFLRESRKKAITLEEHGDVEFQPANTTNEHTDETYVVHKPTMENWTNDLYFTEHTAMYKILPGFKSPKNTNVHCWWDTFPFEGKPVTIPIALDDRKQLTYRTKGCFCSFNCAIAYARLHHMQHYLEDMYYRMYKSREFIKSAPSHTSLNIYGGPMTIEEYRAGCTKGKSFEILPFPMIINCNDHLAQTVRHKAFSHQRTSNDILSRMQDVSAKWNQSGRRRSHIT